MSQYRIPILFLGSIGALITGLAAIQFSQLNNLTQPSNSSQQLSSTEASSQSRLVELRLSLLQEFPDFGFSNLIAGWTFLDFLQYFGDYSQRSQVGYALSPLFFEIIVDRDPHFISQYFYLSHSVSIYAAQPEKAVSLMETALESLTPNLPPQSYLVWRYKAIDELLFLGDGESARLSHINAADWAEQSSDPEASAIAQTSRRTAEFLAENPNSRAAQISSWAQVLVRAVDDRTIQLATEQIEALGGTIVVSESGRASVRYRPD